MPSVSTHVLDASAGGPKSGVEVVLRDGDGVAVARGRTDDAGRIAPLAADVPAGTYRLSWALGGGFLAEVAITVVLDQDRHYHLPLLASPASAVAYLGV